MGLLYAIPAMIAMRRLTSIYRALGTALEWPDAKKKASQVREWGIEVYNRI